MQFMVFSLPRSRSAWLAHWLSVPGALCGHDTLVNCSSIEEFLGQFEPMGALSGSCETGAMVGWRVIRVLMPNARCAVIRRPVREVERSLLRCGLSASIDELLARDAMLDDLQAQPGVMAVQYHHLGNPNTCAHLFEFLTQSPFDLPRWNLYNSTNIQIDMSKRLHELWINYPKHQMLKAEVARRTLELVGQRAFEFN
jgi:hypothetical protein